MGYACPPNPQCHQQWREWCTRTPPALAWVVQLELGVGEGGEGAGGLEDAAGLLVEGGDVKPAGGG